MRIAIRGMEQTGMSNVFGDPMTEERLAAMVRHIKEATFGAGLAGPHADEMAAEIRRCWKRIKELENDGSERG